MIKEHQLQLHTLKGKCVEIKTTYSHRVEGILVSIHKEICMVLDCRENNLKIEYVPIQKIAEVSIINDFSRETATSVYQYVYANNN